MVMSLTGLMQLTCGIPREIGLLFWKFVEVQPSTGRIAFEEVCGAMSWTPSLLRRKMLRTLSLSIVASAWGIWTPDPSIEVYGLKIPPTLCILLNSIRYRRSDQGIVIAASSCTSASAMCVMRMSINSSGGM